MQNVRFLEKSLIAETGHEISCHVIRKVGIKSTIADGNLSVSAIVEIESYKDQAAFEDGLKPLKTQVVRIDELEKQTAYADASAFFMNAVLTSDLFNGSKLKEAELLQPVIPIEEIKPVIDTPLSNL